MNIEKMVKRTGSDVFPDEFPVLFHQAQISPRSQIQILQQFPRWVSCIIPSSTNFTKEPDSNPSTIKTLKRFAAVTLSSLPLHGLSIVYDMVRLSQKLHVLCSQMKQRCLDQCRIITTAWHTLHGCHKQSILVVRC